MPSAGLLRQTDIFCHSPDNNTCPLLAARNRLISSAGRQIRTCAHCWPHETDKYLMPVTRQQHMPSAGLTTLSNLLPNNTEQWVRPRFFVFPLLCSTTILIFMPRDKNLYIFCRSSDNNICPPLPASQGKLMSPAGRKTSIHALGRPHKANKYLLPVARHQNICPLLAEPDRLHQHMPSAGRMRQTNTKHQNTFCRTIQHNGGLDSLFDPILCSSIQGTYFSKSFLLTTNQGC